MLFRDVLLSSADVSIPEIGPWVARVRLADETTLARGDRGELVIGGLRMVGTVVDGADHLGLTDYMIVGGYAGWRKAVQERAYRSDNGIRLRDAARDLAKDVGEDPVFEGPDRTLGYAWIRPAGQARDALERLAVPWWLRSDGRTVFGPRAGGGITADVAVQSYDPVRRTAILGLDDEDLAAVAPGLSLTADGVEQLRIGHVRIVALPRRIFVEVARHPERELVDALLARVEARLRFFGLWPYQVTKQAGARLTLRPQPLASGMPAVPQIDVAHGAGGLADELVPGAVVLVGFRGGDPGAPFVHGVLSGKAASMTLSTEERIRLRSPVVQVGASDHHRVAREGDSVRVDPSLSGSPAVPGGGLLYNPNTQTIQVVPPGTPGAVYFGGEITSGSDVLSSQ